MVDLPDEAAISAATLAELHFGVHLAASDATRRARLQRLAEVEARFEPLPVDAAVARSYGALAHAMVASGRKVRPRAMDVLIAATAHSSGLPLYTRDPRDFAVLADELELHVV